jgi:hypothetical protein
VIIFGKIGLIYQNTTISINQDQYYISATEYLEDEKFSKIKHKYSTYWFYEVYIAVRMPALQEFHDSTLYLLRAENDVYSSSQAREVQSSLLVCTSLDWETIY